ncbi:integration host factor subunit alpha [Caedimonas varicaedens]|uniref:Integration host factor subunit alpha n=1 Tax=Caedimonas varicaedens TaxID=1629334 RepID=A0A0K8MEX8_9PROT|nr:integration host factor subunit alpha [Caedimonas varicaedens]
MAKTLAEEPPILTGSLTRDKLAHLIHEKVGIGKGDARRFVDVAFARMDEGIVKDGKLDLSGFGTFEVIDKKVRKDSHFEAVEGLRKSIRFEQSPELDFTPAGEKKKSNKKEKP